MAIYNYLDSPEKQDTKLAGITTGVVKNNWNKDFPGKVQVELFLGEAGKSLTGWIPVATSYGGNQYGLYALPEIGSEVVVAFQMGNRNYPIVIGCLWNFVNKLPESTPVENNWIKKFRTKGGCEVIFHDEKDKEKITIKTPGGNEILMEDEKKLITIEDKDKKNFLKIDGQNGGVTLTGDKKLTLKAGSGSIEIDGNSGEISIKGNTIKLDGAQTLAMKGNSTKLEGVMVDVKSSGNLNMEASAMTQIKGVMVKIN